MSDYTLLKRLLKPIWLPYKHRVVDKIEEVANKQDHCESLLQEFQIQKIVESIEEVAKLQGRIEKLLQEIYEPVELDEKVKPTNLEIWKSSLHSEYEEWELIILEHSKSESGRDWVSYKNAIFPEEITKLLSPIRDEYDVLDVGSGPRCWLGNTIIGKKVNLVCCDPLAEKYIEYFRKYNLPIIVEPITAQCENLTEKFRFNQFDLVTARNCLDHSYSPEQCILQMLLVSKEIVYLLHCLNEGKNANYQGLHQWDFDVENGDFLIKSRQGEVINFSKKYSHLFSMDIKTFYKNWRGIDQHWLEVILHKKQ